MSVASLTPRVREACGVSTSYDDETIPALIRRCIRRMLRDYHFPKSVRLSVNTPMLNQQAFVLPAGFKKELQVLWHDPTPPGSWSEPLNKSSGLRLPQPDGVPRWYWLQGLDLVTDTPTPTTMSAFQLLIYYESMLVEDAGEETGNETWFCEDFEDVLFYCAVVKGGAEFSKPEVVQTFQPLYVEEVTSLAVYTNELEWGNIRAQMMEPRRFRQERYPRG